jgi:hypothetical protein
VTAPTPSRTPYPVPVAELLPRARKLAADLGTVPSRNRLMAEFRIGAEKARTLLAELTAAPAAAPAEHHLHAVPDQLDTGETDGTTAIAAVPASALVAGVESPDTPATVASVPVAPRRVRSWPVLLLAAPAFIAVWSGWVGLGELTGFGVVHPLPGIADHFTINSAITLPIGVETYAAYALRVWLSGRVPAPARRFAKWSAIGALILGALGQVAYHLLSASGVTSAPWQITTVVACLPVAVLGMGAALAHLLHTDENGKA